LRATFSFHPGFCEKVSGIQTQPLGASPEIVARLSEILIETVAHGGSVSFLHPLDPAVAAAFWERARAAAARAERIILGAFDGADMIGTVSLVFDPPPNQPHRAEIAKMMTHPKHRGRGAATSLMREAENLARSHGRTLLTLDTASEDGASSFYERLGFTFAGEIPDYALKPHGGLTATRFYWKRIDRAG
jgi:ribosomal protein S18 acetylase RimI-like enzyme